MTTQWKGEANLRSKPGPGAWKCVPECLKNATWAVKVIYVHLSLSCSVAMWARMEGSSFRFQSIGPDSMFIPNDEGDWLPQQAAVCPVCATGNLLPSVKHGQKSPKHARKLEHKK